MKKLLLIALAFAMCATCIAPVSADYIPRTGYIDSVYYDLHVIKNNVNEVSITKEPVGNDASPLWDTLAARVNVNPSQTPCDCYFGALTSTRILVHNHPYDSRSCGGMLWPEYYPTKLSEGTQPALDGDLATAEWYQVHSTWVSNKAGYAWQTRDQYDGSYSNENDHWRYFDSSLPTPPDLGTTAIATNCDGNQGFTGSDAYGFAHAKYKVGDLNGNGRLDFDDVYVYFSHIEDFETICPYGFIYPFDYNDNGRCEFDDLYILFTAI